MHCKRIRLRSSQPVHDRDAFTAEFGCIGIKAPPAAAHGRPVALWPAAAAHGPASSRWS